MDELRMVLSDMTMGKAKPNPDQQQQKIKMIIIMNEIINKINYSFVFS